MFKDSNVFKFTNFSFKTKYNNTAVYFVIAFIYSRREKKKKKLFKQLFDQIYCVFFLTFRQNSILTFEGGPNSLTESYLTGELRLGESYFTGDLGLEES